MGDEEEEPPWQCGDAKVETMREFVLPGTKIRLQISQQQSHDRQALFATGDGVCLGGAEATLAYLGSIADNLTGSCVVELGAGGLCGLACSALARRG